MQFSWKEYLADSQEEETQSRPTEQTPLVAACQLLYNAGDSWFNPGPSHDGRISRLWLLKESIVAAGQSMDEPLLVEGALRDMETAMTDVIRAAENLVSKHTEPTVENT